MDEDGRAVIEGWSHVRFAAYDEEPLTTQRHDVVVAIPCYDHHRQVRHVVLGALRFVDRDRVVVIDDGSTPPLEPDDVCGVVLLRHPRNEGLSSAVRTAVEHALATGASGLVKMDADGQMDANALPAFLAALSSGCDVVLGTFDAVRTPRHEWVADRLFSTLFRLATGCAAPTVLAEYRGYSVAALRILLRESPPPWASPLTLFRLRSLRWRTIEGCVHFDGVREFPVGGMWQLRLTFLRYLLHERTVRARALLPVAGTVLFAHMAGYVIARGATAPAARLWRIVRARSEARTSCR